MSAPYIYTDRFDDLRSRHGISPHSKLVDVSTIHTDERLDIGEVNIIIGLCIALWRVITIRPGQLHNIDAVEDFIDDIECGIALGENGAELNAKPIRQISTVEGGLSAD